MLDCHGSCGETHCLSRLVYCDVQARGAQPKFMTFIRSLLFLVERFLISGFVALYRSDNSSTNNEAVTVPAMRGL